MNKQEFLILYQYNAWSNTKIRSAASNVTEEQFLAPVPFPHGSLPGTLVHASFAEWVWRKRWEGLQIILVGNRMSSQPLNPFELAG